MLKHCCSAQGYSCPRWPLPCCRSTASAIAHAAIFPVYSPTKVTCSSKLLLLQMVEKDLGKVDESSAETLIECVNKLQKLKSVKGGSLGDTRSTQWAA